MRPETVSVSLQDLNIPPALLTRIPRPSSWSIAYCRSVSPLKSWFLPWSTPPIFSLSTMSPDLSKGVTVTPVRMTENDFNVFMRQTYPVLTKGDECRHETPFRLK